MPADSVAMAAGPGSSSKRAAEAWALLQSSSSPSCGVSAAPPASSSGFDAMWASLRSGGVKSSQPDDASAAASAESGAANTSSIASVLHSLNLGASANNNTAAASSPNNYSDSAATAASKAANQQALTASSSIPALRDAPLPESESGTPTHADFDALEMALVRDVNALTEPGFASRKAALRRINAAMLGPGRPTDPAIIAEACNDLLGKPLIKSLEDTSEPVREAAVCTLQGLLSAHVGAAIDIMPYLLPALVERTNRTERGDPTEPSEEVRLRLIKLLQAIVDAGKEIGPDLVRPYAEDICIVLRECSVDAYHSVLEATCACCESLVALMRYRLTQVVKGEDGRENGMANWFFPMLGHRRHRVRACAIKCLKSLLGDTGGHEKILEIVAFQDPNTVPIKAFYGEYLKRNYIGALSHDDSPHVRLEMLHTIAYWMLDMHERLDHEARLMPYVLSALNDESAAASDFALATLERLGAQYEKEKKDDLKDIFHYYGEDVGTEDEAYGVVGTPERIALPHPITTRPGLGTRLIVFGNFTRYLYAMVGEIEKCWEKLGTLRIRATRLLEVSILCSEARCEKELHNVLPPVSRVARDPEVADGVARCLAYVGHFATPSIWHDLLSPRLDADFAVTDAPAVFLGTLTSYAHLLRGTPPSRAANLVTGQVQTLFDDAGLFAAESQSTRDSILTLALAASRHVCACSSLAEARSLLARAARVALWCGASANGSTTRQVGSATGGGAGLATTDEALEAKAEMCLDALGFAYLHLPQEGEVWDLDARPCVPWCDERSAASAVVHDDTTTSAPGEKARRLFAAIRPELLTLLGRDASNPLCAAQPARLALVLSQCLDGWRDETSGCLEMPEHACDTTDVLEAVEATLLTTSVLLDRLAALFEASTTTSTAELVDDVIARKALIRVRQCVMSASSDMLGESASSAACAALRASVAGGMISGGDRRASWSTHRHRVAAASARLADSLVRRVNGGVTLDWKSAVGWLSAAESSGGDFDAAPLAVIRLTEFALLRLMARVARSSSPPAWDVDVVRGVVSSRIAYAGGGREKEQEEQEEQEEEDDDVLDAFDQAMTERSIGICARTVFHLLPAEVVDAIDELD